MDCGDKNKRQIPSCIVYVAGRFCGGATRSSDTEPRLQQFLKATNSRCSTSQGMSASNYCARVDGAIDCGSCLIRPQDTQYHHAIPTRLLLEGLWHREKHQKINSNPDKAKRHQIQLVTTESSGTESIYRALECIYTHRASEQYIKNSRALTPPMTLRWWEITPHREKTCRKPTDTGSRMFYFRDTQPHGSALGPPTPEL